MNKPFKRVAVLMGGFSREREVSERSGAAVAKGLRSAGYDVLEVDLRNAELNGLLTNVDAAFIALHGEFGEDGKVQRLLENRGLPYTGSAPGASEIAFDKRLSKQVLIQAGIPTPAYEILGAGAQRTIPLPVVIKPPCQGSSLGVHRVFGEGEWASALADALRFGDEVIVEPYIAGRELTVGIVGGEALPVVEIVAPDGWYDYEAKYTTGRTDYVVPARLDEAVAWRCRQLAVRTFEAMGCRGFGRVDFRLSENGDLWVLELNSIPGFTETSLLPKAAEAAGIGFPDLCDRIMRLAAV